MTALLTDNLPLMAGAPNGIKKLRELILELAVRGKLVPQDPNDEPASELLKRIAEEKKRLAAEGKIKKNRQEEYEVTEVHYSIPQTWGVASLGQVVEIVRGITFPASEKSRTPEPGRVACLRTANVQDEIEWDDLLYIRESFVSREDQYIQPRDIVMSMANSRELVGKVAIIDAELTQKTSFGGFLGVLRPVFIEPRFVMALLRTPHARGALIDSSNQTTNIANVSLAKLKPLPLAIPPLPEQHRIVAKVDELMALCDRLEAEQADAESAHAQLVQALLDSLTQASDATDFAANWQRLAEHFHHLFTTEPSIDALKQTLLQLAVMGKLVPQAPTDEPASELLKRIQAEKNRLAAEGKLKRQKPLREISEADTPFEIPDTWQWARLEDISHVFSGNAFKSEDFQEEPGVKVIKITNAGVGEFIKTDEYLPAQYGNEYTSFRVFENDLILALTRPYISSGLKISRCPAEYDGALLNQRVASIRIFPDFNNEFGFLFFKSPTVLAIYQERFGNSGLQPNLKMSDVTSLLIPIPPIEEQHRIVAKINQITTLCDIIKIKIKKSHHLIEDLSSALIVKGLA